MIPAILIFNCILMFLSWIACLVITTPPYNHFIQYGDTGGILPNLTQIIIDARLFLILIPIIWIIFSLGLYKKIKERQKQDQGLVLILFSLVSLSTGFVMMIIFGLAAILPYLKIGTAV